jgi:hypothetical protein
MCKFGDKCNKYANNNCNFYHPPSQQSNQMLNYDPNIEQQAQRQPRMCRFGINCKDLANNSCNFYHPPSQGNGGTFGGMGGGMMDNGMKGWAGGIGGGSGKPWQKDQNVNGGFINQK